MLLEIMYSIDYKYMKFMNSHNVLSNERINLKFPSVVKFCVCKSPAYVMKYILNYRCRHFTWHHYSYHTRAFFSFFRLSSYVYGTLLSNVSLSVLNQLVLLCGILLYYWLY